MTANPLVNSNRTQRRVAARRWPTAILLLLAALVLLGWVWRARRVSTLWRAAREAVRSADWDRAEHNLAIMGWYGALEGESLRMRIAVARRRGDMATTAALLGRVQGSQADMAAARLEQGRLLIELGRLNEAERVYRLLLETQPTSAPARRGMIAVLGLAGRREEQEEQLWQLHDLAGSRRDLRVEALCLLARGVPVIPGEFLPQGTDEGRILERGVEAEPENGHVRAALAHFLRNRGRLDDARRILEDKITSRGTPPAVEEEFLALLLDEGRFDEAENWLARTVDRPVSATARYVLLRGIWQSLSEGQAKGELDFREAVKRDQRDPEPRHRLAQSLRAQGRTEEAAVWLGWVEDARLLNQIAASLDYASPDPAAMQQASSLCRRMQRDREADAWEALLGSGARPPESSFFPRP
jgi:Flp pilus assembly protein TadD